VILIETTCEKANGPDEIFLQPATTCVDDDLSALNTGFPLLSELEHQFLMQDVRKNILEIKSDSCSEN